MPGLGYCHASTMPPIRINNGKRYGFSFGGYQKDIKKKKPGTACSEFFTCFKRLRYEGRCLEWKFYQVDSEPSAGSACMQKPQRRVEISPRVYVILKTYENIKKRIAKDVKDCNVFCQKYRKGVDFSFILIYNVLVKLCSFAFATRGAGG